jgi:IS30 family transposase
MYNQLTREQRYAIFLGRQKGETNKKIAETIGVHPSTVGREIFRNSTPGGKYLWDKAEDKARGRKTRHPGNRAVSEILKWRVKQYLMEEQWSPGQISGYLLKKDGIKISHETIYKMIRTDETGKLAENCRHKMKYRRAASKKYETKATNIKNRISIHERPPEANGKRFGDWEMDLILDKDNNAILTMVERRTNFLLMSKLKYGKRAMPLAKVVRRLLLPYKGALLKTITTDNGSEFAAHEWIKKQLDVTVYFTDSYSAWQKGTIENTNKLIRQYIPKGADISKVTDKKIEKLQAKINRRPREKLNFSTPKIEFYKFYS